MYLKIKIEALQELIDEELKRTPKNWRYIDWLLDELNHYDAEYFKLKGQ